MTIASVDGGKPPSFAETSNKAMLKSGECWARGLRSMAEHYAQSSAEQIEKIAHSWREISAARSVEDLKSIQARLAREFYDRSMTDASRFVGEFVSLTNKTLAVARGVSDVEP